MCSSKGLFFAVGLVSACMLLASPSTTKADLMNPSFEAPDIPTGGDVIQLPDYWNWAVSAIVRMEDQSGGSTAIDGTQWVSVHPTGYVWQNTGIAVQNGWSYALSFYGKGDGRNGQCRVSLLAADDTASLGTSLASQDLSTTPAWAAGSVSTTYSGAAGKYLSISLADLASPAWADFDHCVLTITPIPEPSIMLLCVSGILGLVAYAWRKRR
jgi:hypothetical protein